MATDKERIAELEKRLADVERTLGEGNTLPKGMYDTSFIQALCNGHLNDVGVERSVLLSLEPGRSIEIRRYKQPAQEQCPH
ncbi:hypothetical protein [Bradyrhizobium sp. CCGUVB14]|uniref:hypothetical protein n=1 Tax=Bradyrhizobium sp. CCGUVB14 TaxID=2949628 RepID=UPI0020B283F1|nr:hypothetical protein [Bradyrhizobium sp. CCGUVB14]MCP3444193.1 hypothetical protein [Bradyrhizobium sp. CCGUVB14]